MDLNVNDLITLDDNNEYVIVAKNKYESKMYFYIVDIKDNSNLKFCYLDNDELVEVNDSELIKKLLSIFKEMF